MKLTHVALHRDFEIGAVDPRLFSGFSEHVGRIIYGGLYDPKSRYADEDGLRRDVMEAFRKLNFNMVRYPGGNFSSGYHWRDGVGPKETRPRVLERAFNSIETNQFGTDEFMTLCRKMAWQPMMTANLGTGTPEEAADWVEYCNLPAGTRHADMRVANGQRNPYAAKLWCLGNEIDGVWQLGHVPAHEYALRALQAAKIMKDTDKSIELVACGTCYPDQPTYIDWDRTVLETMGELADYLSLHYYYKFHGDTEDYLASTNAFDCYIRQMDAVCRIVQAKHRSKKRAYLSFDEYNVYWNHFPKPDRFDGRLKIAPRITEEVYTLRDALVIAGFLHSFLRHADVVKIANISQLVNTIGVLRTEGDAMVCQTIYWPLAMMAKRQQGVALRPVVKGPTFEGKRNGVANYIDASAILGDGQLHVFLTNRSESESAPVQIDLSAFGTVAVKDAEILSGPKADTVNTFKKPDAVRARPFSRIRATRGQVTLTLPRLSYVAATLSVR